MGETEQWTAWHSEALTQIFVVGFPWLISERSLAQVSSD